MIGVPFFIFFLGTGRFKMDSIILGSMKIPSEEFDGQEKINKLDKKILA